MNTLCDVFFMLALSIGFFAIILGGLYIIVLIFELLVMAFKKMLNLRQT